MVDNVGPVIVKDLIHSPAVAHRTDQNNKIKFRMLFAQFKLDVVGVVFVNIKNYQSAGTVAGNLAAKLRANTAAASRNHNGFPVNKPEHLIHVRFDRVSAEKIFD